MDFIMSKISFRDFSAGDEELFYRLANMFYETTEATYDTNQDNIRKTFSHCINNSPYIRGIFAIYNNEICGYALLTYTYSNEYGGKTMAIDEMFISDKFKNKGIGGHLCYKILYDYTDDITCIEESVHQDNKRVLRLCERFGFVKDDYIAMHKDIDQKGIQRFDS